MKKICVAVLVILILCLLISCAAHNSDESHESQQPINDPDEIRLEYDNEKTVIKDSSPYYEEIVSLTLQRFTDDMSGVAAALTREDCVEEAKIVMEYVYNQIQPKRKFAAEEIQKYEYNRLLFCFGNDYDTWVMALDGKNEDGTFSYTAYTDLISDSQVLQDAIKKVFD